MTDVGDDPTSTPHGAESSTEPIYQIAECHDCDVHHLRVLEPASETYLKGLAREYRRLRTTSNQSVQALTLDGVEVLAVDGVRKALAEATVPQYQRGNFGVVRSDLAEVLLGLVGEQTYCTRYAYRSVRDRELVQLPGRGIDQIGVELDLIPAGDGPAQRSRLTLVLGEAKVSTDRACPPRVVDKAADSLRAQHLGHLADREAAANKIWDASRRSCDEETQNLLRTAAELFRRQVDDGSLRVVVASLVVRPSGYATPQDFGTFHSSTSDYSPADIRFYIFRLPGDLDVTVQEFAQLARSEREDGPA